MVMIRTACCFLACLFILPRAGFAQLIASYGGTLEATQSAHADYPFTADAGQAILISVSEAGDNTAFWPGVVVTDQSGQQVGGNVGDRYGIARMQTPAAGAYNVRVYRWTAQPPPIVPSSYHLDIWRVPGGGPLPAGYGGGSINSGQTISNHLYRGALHPYTFNGRANDRVSITINQPGARADYGLSFQLLGPKGYAGVSAPSGATTAAYGAQNATLKTTLPFDGTYTIFASRFNPGGLDGDHGGDYELTLLGATGLPATAKENGATFGMCPRACGLNSIGAASVADPVTLSNGNLFQAIDDYRTVGPNSLAFSRYYNSRAGIAPTFATALGLGWRSTFDRYINTQSSTGVLAERADGRILGFTLVGGMWTPDQDVDIRLVQSGSTWTLTDADDTVETYSAVSATNAQLMTIQARNGYTQTLLYDAGNRLMSVTDSYNRTLAFTYAGNLLNTLTTPDNQAFTYSFTAQGSLSLLTDVSYSTDPPTGQSYLYENTALPFMLTGIVDENGVRSATFGYDLSSRATSSRHAAGSDLFTISYDDSKNQRTVTNPLGQQEVYTFSVYQNLPKLTRIDRLATATTAGAFRIFTYDANGYRAASTDWNGNPTRNVNDAHGQPTSITEAAGKPEQRTTTISYDATYRLATRITEPGLVTDLSYDGAGNLTTKTLTDSATGRTRTWTSTWDKFELATMTNPNGAVTTFTYAEDGTRIGVEDVLHHKTTVSGHLPGGLPTVIVDQNGVVRHLSYDNRLRLIGSTVDLTPTPATTTFRRDAAGNVITTTLPDGSTVGSVYDDAHRLIGVIDHDGDIVGYTLDAMGNRLSTTINKPDGTITLQRSASFDALGRMLNRTGGESQTTAYTYDAQGNTLTSTDALHNETSATYDALNRVIAVTDPMNGVTTTRYDTHDRPVSVTDPNGGVTQYSYDGFGSVVQLNSPDTGLTQNAFDDSSNLTQQIDARGVVKNQTYDALDRPLLTTYPASPAEDVSRTYDEPGHGFGIGRLTTVADAVGTLRLSYDERGAVLSNDRTTSEARLTTGYGFDINGLPASIRYPSGLQVLYTRDHESRISAVDILAPGATAPQHVATLTHQPFGPEASILFGNDIQETFAYDPDQRLARLSDVTGSGVPVQDLAYGYTLTDDIRQITDAVSPGNSQALEYDSLDRLTGATGWYGTYGWSYDPNGNRLKQALNADTTTYGYAPNSNRLTAVAVRDVSSPVTSTENGAITSLPVNSGAPAAVAYNNSGQPASIAGPTLAASYAYDAFDQRVSKTISGSSTFFTQGQGGELLERSDNAAIQLDYIYADGRPVAEFLPLAGQLYFLHGDNLGTPQKATNAIGTVVWNPPYTPFGKTGDFTSTLAQDLRLPGQFVDAESGLHHNGFREYGPLIGRYLKSDPIGLAGGLNTYAYGDGNPASNIDPRGLIFSVPGSLPFGPYGAWPATPQDMQRFASWLEHHQQDDIAYSNMILAADAQCIRGAYSVGVGIFNIGLGTELEATIFGFPIGVSFQEYGAYQLLNGSRNVYEGLRNRRRLMK